MGDSLLQLVDYGEDSDSSVESQQLNITKSTVQKPNDEVVHQKADTIEKAPSIEEQEGSKDYEIVSPKEQQPTEDTEQKFEIDQRIYDILTPKPIPNVPNWGIEDEPEGECDPGLQAKIEKFYEMRKQGLYFNAQMAKNKQYQNPNIYARLVEHLDLEQTGSNFDTSDFDPNGFPKELVIAKAVRGKEEGTAETWKEKQHILSTLFNYNR
ncbi:SAP30-binding protein [Mycoemilia scoparia]|uniref:SAP30-binding protein n=1 Tax=Mycoemilia scoparia TaxID=417184 RepID=A0A9W7ZPD5_9FUNG|nr:SAP30-binding protein [Mycoemilia scoparia]